jgi:hypothetical protein
MKTKSLIAAMFLTAAVSGPAAEAGRIPFNGTMEASETYQLFGDPPFGFFVNAGGTATTTQLGQFTLLYTVLADLNSPTGEGFGRAWFIAANGDSIFASSTAVSGPTPDPDVFFIVETYTITGGRGRYADAKGSFTLNRSVNVVTGATTGSFNGTIIVRDQH